MTNIFKVKNFQFPYDYKFPGQANDEKILFVTRENRLMLKLRQIFIVFISIIVLLLGFTLANFLNKALEINTVSVYMLSLFLSLLFFVIGWWWINLLWKKSLCIVTNKRLTKYIYTTPASRYSLSLPLGMIVDTGAYSKGFTQAFLKLGTFVARSSAASSGVSTDSPSRINKKYFYINHINCAEDLQHYVNKLLSNFRKNDKNLDKFRPFIPHLKGEKRKEFMKKYPEYWS